MNRIDKLFTEKTENILSVFFTAGIPEKESTMEIVRLVSETKVDMIEIGMPFSDSVVDGELIRNCNTRALKNGMNIPVLLKQLENLREVISVPVLLMGYFNPVLQYGFDRFIEKISSIGIDGLIIPDLPLDEYTEHYEKLFQQFDIRNVPIITPQTSESRIWDIDSMINGFIYIVSSASVTGESSDYTPEQLANFKRIREMKLKNPCLIGFGIDEKSKFSTVCSYAQGGIIGSDFIRFLQKSSDLKENVVAFEEKYR